MALRQLLANFGIDRVTDAISVTAIYRYPVKGLSAQALPSVKLEQDEAIPFDRAWAIENGPSRFDPQNPQHLPKVAFLMLMRDERLATFQTEFDEATRTLTIKRGGKAVCRGDLSTKTGRALIEQFLAAYMKDNLRGPAHIVGGVAGHSLSNIPEKRLHIINLATLTDVERVVGRRLDPLRFRPNVIITGAPAWSEFSWIGQEFRVGSSGVRLEVIRRTRRCPATNVEPSTGVRDADIPARLERQWGHSDFGVYARVTARGLLAIGDHVEASKGG